MASSTGFFGWLRGNAEHYLLVDAHRRVAARVGTTPPRAPKGFKEIFWLKIFAPIYAVLPWPLRHQMMKAMPGSHKRPWAQPAALQGPAI